jgi:demethylmenaquinone methyltransferase/2-methoxy-6-polyprenyl-1,4-benzoquinol methylase
MREMTRVSRPKEAARETYDRLSRWYDLLAGASERRFRNLGLQLLDAQPGERVLELGFGTGHALVDLARAVGEEGFVTGVDLSKGMARVAHERVNGVEISARVALCIGDAAGQLFRSGSFDAVFMSFTLELFDTPQIATVLATCRSVLRPEGRLGVVALTKYGDDNLAVNLYEWVHHRMPAWVDCRPIPLRPILDRAGFHMQKAAAGTMWGLPVEAVVALPKGDTL